MRRRASKLVLLFATSGIVLQLGGCLLGLATDFFYTNTIGFVFDSIFDAIRGEDDPAESTEP